MDKITPEGLRDILKLKQELELLKTETTTRLATTREAGDLKENSEYHEAKSSLAQIMADLQDLNFKLNNAQMITIDPNKKTVDIGAYVTLERLPPKVGQVSYKVVSALEADLSSNKISDQSPLGIAMLGLKKGDIFQIPTSTGNNSYKIIDFTYLPSVIPA